MNSASTLFDIITSGRAYRRRPSEDGSLDLSIEELAMVHGGSGGATAGASGNAGHGGKRRNEQQPNLPGNAALYDGGSSAALSSHGGGSGPDYPEAQGLWESPTVSDPFPAHPLPHPIDY